MPKTLTSEYKLLHSIQTGNEASVSGHTWEVSSLDVSSVFSNYHPIGAVVVEDSLVEREPIRKERDLFGFLTLL